MSELTTKQRYYQENKHKWVEYRRRSYATNREGIRLSNRRFMDKWRKEIRTTLFNILGGAKCIKCGFTDIRALQFDHINGGGIKDLKKHHNSMALYQYYVKHPEEAKQKLQVLCANCNWIKRHENTENLRKYEWR